MSVAAHGPVSREYAKIDVLAAVRDFINGNTAGLRRLAGEYHVESDV